MKIDLDYGIKRDPSKAAEEKQLSNSELTFDYISYAVAQKYKEGISGSLRRIWGRIQRKFDEAYVSGSPEITLESSEIDFLKKLFTDEIKFPQHLSKFITTLETEIESLKSDN